MSAGKGTAAVDIFTRWESEVRSYSRVFPIKICTHLGVRKCHFAVKLLRLIQLAT